MKTRFWIKTTSVIVLVLCLIMTVVLMTRLDKKSDDDYKTGHEVVATYVTEKRFQDGYSAGWYGYVAPVYMIKSEDKTGTVYTSYVLMTTYDSYEVGDTIYICIAHSKVVDEEEK